MTKFQYDANDNVRSVAYATGRQVGYEFDAENRISRVYDAGTAHDYARECSYHPSGQITSYTTGDGTAHQVTFDSLRYWVRSVDAGPLHFTYDNYDGVGNVRTIGDDRSGAGQTFTYDVLDRLVTASGPYGPVNYAYDAHGNRTSTSLTTYAYDPAKLWLTSQGGSAFTYDLNGNLKTTPSASYTYTPDNMIDQATVGSTVTTYRYDADAWRVKHESIGAETYSLRGLHGELLSDWRNPGAAGEEVRDYVYVGSRLIAVAIR